MNQPKALYLLNFVSMWECFSYYGMRALLVLFMADAMLLGDAQAFGLYTLYTSLLELGGVLGGMVADRYLGLKRTISAGGWTILVGHLCLSLLTAEYGFYLGLGLIVVGTGLFRSNVAALLGKFYTKDDPRRQAGYTLYYTGINIGGFLAALCCGAVGELYGWHAGFALAALGMLAGNLALMWGSRLLADETVLEIQLQAISYTKSAVAIALAASFCAALLFYQSIMSLILPLMMVAVCYAIYNQLKGVLKVQQLMHLCALVIFMIIFYGCEEQLGSTLVLFAERHVDRKIFSYSVPASSLIMFNPLTILVAGPLLSRFFQGVKLDDLVKLALSFVMLSLSFCMLYVGCLSCGPTEIVPLSLTIASIVCMAIGEILIGPTVYAAGSAMAPAHLQGATMGMITLGFALANLFSGYLSQLMVVSPKASSIAIYSHGFQLIGYGALVVALFVFVYISLIRKEEIYDAS